MAEATRIPAPTSQLLPCHASAIIKERVIHNSGRSICLCASRSASPGKNGQKPTGAGIMVIKDA